MCDDHILGWQQISDRKWIKSCNGVTRQSEPHGQSRSQRWVVSWVSSEECYKTPDSDPYTWLGSFSLPALHTGSATGPNRQAGKLYACPVCFRNVHRKCHKPPSCHLCIPCPQGGPEFPAASAHDLRNGRIHACLPCLTCQSTVRKDPASVERLCQGLERTALWRAIITNNKQECVTMARISCWDNSFTKPLRKVGCFPVHHESQALVLFC